MANTELGKFLCGKESRDAIHVAIAAVVASEKLAPGQDIGLIEDGNYELVGVSDRPIGIVDPFLKQMVYKDQRFWMLLYPGTITTLRHEWVHPAFQEPPLHESEKWLREFAESAGLGYMEMLDIVRDYVESGEVWVEHGSESARNAFYACDRADFWKHISCVTGLSVPVNPDWDAPFTCSC